MKETMKIFGILTLVIGTIILSNVSIEVIKTSVLLSNYTGYISDYNQTPVKTDAMTKEYVEVNELREAIYNSDNVVVRTFSTQHTLVKMVGLVAAIAYIPVISLVWMRVFVLNVVNPLRRKRRKSSKTPKGNCNAVA